MSDSNKTLKIIALIKLEEIERTLKEFESFCEDYEGCTGTRLEKLGHQLEKARKFWGIADVNRPDKTEIRASNRVDSDTLIETIQNCQRDLARAKIDPSADFLVDDVEKQLSSLIDVEKKQLEYTKLFTTEILNAYADDERVREIPQASRSDRVEQLEKWREAVKRPDDVDPQQIAKFLEETFRSTAKGRLALDKFRDTIKHIKTPKIDAAYIRDTIVSLCSSNSLSDSQTAVLKEYKKSEIVLKELANVIALRMDKLDEWKWTLGDNNSIRAYQQRALNGKYRVYFDQDILDIILWWAIGTTWRKQFQRATSAFRESQWGTSDKVVDQEATEIRRRKYYLNCADFRDHVATKLDTLYRADFFMSLLGEHSRGGYSGENNSNDKSKAAENVQNLLRHIAADVKIRKLLEEPVAVLTADFEWFGPSISHTAVREVLEFFGMPEMWLNLFMRYLGIPFQFEGCPVETRTRGLPMSSSVSDVCSEMLLFGLDYAFNQATNTNLFRINDDISIWGKPETVLKGWNVLSDFNKVMGLTLNKEKTGCKSSIPLQGLPNGDVHYGYLGLNDDIEFTADLTVIEKSFDEMARQLSVYSSPFTRIKAYNRYAKFILNKCMKPNRAFGLGYVDTMISAFTKPHDPSIQSTLELLVSKSNLGGDWRDLPRAVWYWPIDLGGFNLFDPLVDLLKQRESIIREEKERNKRISTDQFLEEYEVAKRNYEERANSPSRKTADEEVNKWRAEGFMEYSEFKKWIRLSPKSGGEGSVETMFDYLLSDSSTVRIDRDSAKIDSLLKQSPFSSDSRIKPSMGMMTSYWRDIVGQHLPELMEKQGKVQLIASKLVPLGLAKALVEKPQRWNA